MLAGVNHVAAQGTAFTYQGQLYDGANLANGFYDIRGGLYATNTGGTGTATINVTIIDVPPTLSYAGSPFTFVNGTVITNPLNRSPVP